jgi:nitrite reductase/ring-hydroxylating ferredoxin subunit
MTTTRRTFLQVVGAGAGAVTLGGFTLACGAAPLPAGGQAKDVPQGLSQLSGQSVILGRDAGGLFAMSSICTHAGCDMVSQGSITSSDVTCLCHGSVFDTSGAPTAGPANQPLQHFAVTIAADGTFSVDTGTTVSAATRAAIPA